MDICEMEQDTMRYDIHRVAVTGGKHPRLMISRRRFEFRGNGIAWIF